MKVLGLLSFILFVLHIGANGQSKQRLKAYSIYGQQAFVDTLVVIDTAVYKYPTPFNEGGIESSTWVINSIWKYQFESKIKYKYDIINKVWFPNTKESIKADYNSKKTLYQKFINTDAIQTTWKPIELQDNYYHRIPDLIDSLDVYSWRDGSMFLRTKNVAKYDNNDNQIELLIFNTQDNRTDAILDKEYKSSFNNRNQLIKRQSKDYNDSVYTYLEQIFDFDKRGNKIYEEKVQSNFDSTDVYRTKDFWHFDSLNNIDIFITLNWNEKSSSWDTTNHVLLNYYSVFDSNGNLVEKLWERKSNVAMPFVNNGKSIFEYDGQNRLRKQINYVWKSGVWEFSNEYRYSFNQQDKLDTTEVFELRDSSIVLDNRYIYEYDNNGNQIKKTFQNGFNGEAYEITNYYWEDILNQEKDESLDFAVSSYPNPFGNSINFVVYNINPDELIRINIYDITGKELHRHKFVSHSNVYNYVWNASGFNAGIYIAKIRVEEKEAGLQIIKE